MISKRLNRLLNVALTAVFFGFWSTSGLATETEDSHRTLTSRLPLELVEAFNTQIKNELDGAHFYLSLANHFYEKSLDGFGFWFSQQYYEELNHARIMMDFVKKKGANVNLTSVLAPDAIINDEPAAIFDQSLTLEQEQSARIATLHEQANKFGARDAASFLQWFIDEQVQEEDHFQNVLDRLRMVQNSLEGILLIDKDLAARVAAVVWMPGQPLPPH